MQEDLKTKAESGLDRALGFAKSHPIASVLGVAGFGLLGGIELVAGVAIVAGVAGLARSPELRDRARSLLGRAPHEVRERARAVVQAVRGKNAPADAAERAPEPQPSEPVV